MMRVLHGAKTVALAQVNAYCYHLRADSAVHSAADVVREYLRTLTAAQPTLNYLDMPDAAAQYRLMHLLLMLTHGVVQEGGFRDGLRQCRAIRRLCREAFRADLRRVRWLPRSKAQAVLLMLRCGLYPLARRAILIRRRQNQQACALAESAI